MDKDEESISLYSKAANWLFNQSATTVLLVAVLAFFGYGLVYLVPIHLKIINDGYTEVADRFIKHNEVLEEKRNEQIREIGGKIETLSDSIKEANHSQNQLIRDILKLQQAAMSANNTH